RCPPACPEGAVRVHPLGGQSQCFPVIDIEAHIPHTKGNLCAGNPILPLTGTKTQSEPTGIKFSGMHLQFHYSSRYSNWGYDETQGPAILTEKIASQPGELVAH